MHLRVRLGQLELLLGQGDALRHREDVRVADRDNVDAAVKVSGFHPRLTALDHVGVRRQRFLGHDTGQDAELLLLGVMQPLVNGGHDLHATLEHGDRSPDRHLLVHVADLLVRDRHEPAASVDEGAQQVGQSGRRLLVGQGHDRISEHAAGGIHIPPLARLNRLVAVADPHTAGLEATGQVRQGARVDQLTQDAGRGLANPADHVQQAKAVEAQPRQELVVRKVGHRPAKAVALTVVPADCKHRAAVFVDGHDIRQLDAARFAVRAHVLETLKVQLDMNF